jgi:gliding motility-associated-like protein
MELAASKYVLLNSYIILLIVIALSQGLAQNKSNRGKEFWLGYGHNSFFVQPAPVTQQINHQTFALYIYAQDGATVTVSINGTSWSQTVNIPVNGVDASIIIPKTAPNDARLTTEGLSTKGIHIVASNPIVVYMHQYEVFSSGAAMLMPVETFGYNYTSVNMKQTSNEPDGYSWMFIVASEDNTRIRITPSDSTEGGWLSTQSYIVNLNKGEIYNLFGKKTGTYSSKDLTGTKVVSIAGSDGNCHPIGMFCGASRNVIQNSECVGNFYTPFGVYNGNGGEILLGQMFPANAWGTRYLTHHIVNNLSSNLSAPFKNIYRIAVQDPTTIVKRNGTLLTGLISNFYYDISSYSGDLIEADKPILVAQFLVNNYQCNPPGLSIPDALGDPEMILLSPIEQGVKYTKCYQTKNSGINLVYIQAIVKTSGLPSMLINGTPIDSWETILHPQDNNYSVIVRRSFESDGYVHTISCDSSFVGITYGQGVWESYGYNIGCLVNNLNTYGAIKNVFSAANSIDTFTCRNTPFRLQAKIAYKLTNIHWKLSQVVGISPNTDSIITNPVPVDSSFINGRKYYTYTLQQDFVFSSTGTYNIPISYTAPDIDVCNNTETFLLDVIVKNGPTANFNFTNPVCLKDSAYFTGTIANANGFTINQYLWNFADATTAITQNTVKKFITPGTQNVRFRIFATNGCSGDTTKPVTINDSPKANFGVTPTTICAKDSVQLTDTSSISIGSITNYEWNFGDGVIINRNTNSPFYHTYNNGGNYTIKLVASSNNSCKSDTAYRTVTVHAKPVAKFGIDRNICINDSIRLTDTSSISSGSIIFYRWNFGDGNTLVRTTNTPFYQPYTSAGNFTVSLVTVSNNGCISDTAKKLVIVSNKPTVTIALVGKPCIDSNFIFTSSYPFSTGVRWYWNFGDGQFTNSTTSNTATHSYAAILTNLTIKHLVDLGGGCYSDTITTIVPSIHANPIADFTIDDDTLCVNTPLLFTSTVVGNYLWNWNFGNGTGNNIPPFIKTYTAAGTYNISLQLKDANGCGSAVVNDQLSIAANPIVNAGMDKFIQTGSSVTLDGSVSPAGNYTYTWSPAANLTSASILNPVATPPASITYLLNVNNPLTNCYGEDAVTISVIDKLYIPNSFTPNKDGKNDTWDLLGLALYPDAVVTIYNRWGQKIVATKQYYLNPWNGTYKSIDVPAGTYIYSIQLNNSAKEIKKGTLMIIR